MAMDAAMIERLIKESLPDAQVSIEDLRGDGDHYAAHVVSGAFRGKSRVQQHQMVYQALRGRMGNELHALALQTERPRGMRLTVATQTFPQSRNNKMDSTVQDRIRQQITDTPVVLFMKGTPVFPQCGFSAAVVQILSQLGVKFKGVDVLADPSVRAGHQGILELADDPAALRQGRVRRRLRHHPRDVRDRRIAAGLRGKGRPGPRLTGSRLNRRV